MGELTRFEKKLLWELSEIRRVLEKMEKAIRGKPKEGGKDE